MKGPWEDPADVAHQVLSALREQIRCDRTARRASWTGLGLVAVTLGIACAALCGHAVDAPRPDG